MNRSLKVFICLFITSILSANEVMADIINYDYVSEGPDEIRILAGFLFIVFIIGSLSLITLLVIKKYLKIKMKKMKFK